MKTLLEYLEKSNNRNPSKIAVIDENNQCTYKELIDNAKSIGTYLIKKTLPRQSVAVLMDKSVKTLQIFFGIEYAGCFYTLIDPSFPKERVKQILSVLNPSLIISSFSYKDRIGELQLDDKVTYLEKIPEEVDERGLLVRRQSMIDTDPVYCNFTSGSTGVPKGVLVSHRSVVDFIEVFTKTFALSEQDVFANQAPFDFDVSVKDIYSSVKLGATLVLIPKSYFMFPVKVVDMLEKYHVTTMIWAVSALCMLMRLHALKYLRPSCINKVMFSGEVMPIKQFNQWKSYYPEAMFVNLYGPTEITCNCTYYIVNKEFTEGDKIPMGVPFDNEKVFLLDDNNKLVSEGGVGEVCVAGTTLALGYYNNTQMTDKNFIQNPLQHSYPEIIYRTGDLATLKDGNFIFVGRKDFQIKHMGHRIELEEIEAVLSSIEGVNHACCVYDTKRNRVIAFYSGEADKVAIISEMKKVVPEYMVPNSFKQLNSLPLTKNGKTDRKLLLEQYNGGL